MIEWVLAPLAIGAIGVLSPMFNKMNDKEKLDRIFKNMGLGVNQDGKHIFPKFKRKDKLGYEENETFIETGTVYVYQLPLGLPPKAIQRLQENGSVLSDGLNKPVELMYDGMLNIKVYNEKLDTLIKFEKVPITKGWKLPLGKHYSGWIVHDFDSIPHMVIGGTTRFGKSVLLKTMMTQLILANPDDVEFYVIDLKGGLEFWKYRHLKQVKGIAKNYAEALKLLLDIEIEMFGELDEERGIREGGLEEMFLRNGWNNVVDSPFKKRRFVIVDEGAQLAPEKWMKPSLKHALGHCQYILSEIARIGGALGYRLIFTTQYPTADCLPKQIKMNSDIKISFRLGTGYASEVVLDERGAEDLPTDIKGRALVKTHELREMQVPLIKDDEMWRLLERYDESGIIQYREEENTTRGNTPDLRSLGICDEGTATKGS